MKIFENIVHQQVSEFLKQNDILLQSGFRTSHSTDTAVLCVSDYILEELSKGQYVRAVLVDLKKAFDTVDHGIFLKKLFYLGFRDASFDWSQFYLCDRLQCSVIRDKQSSFLKEDHFGVPQGSVLFLIYMNDIFICINSNTFCHLYAYGLIQQLEFMSTWFYNNKLSINTTRQMWSFLENQ